MSGCALNYVRETASDATSLARGVRGLLWGYILTPAAAVSNVDIFDGLNAGGKQIGEAQAAANGNSAVVMHQRGVPFQDGLDVVLAGAGASVLILWEPMT